jgi:hypothetical protein
MSDLSNLRDLRHLCAPSTCPIHRSPTGVLRVDSDLHGPQAAKSRYATIA